MTAFALHAEFCGDGSLSFDWRCAGGAFADEDASGVSVGVAGRLSNHAELIRSLGLSSDWNCAELVREGWLRWGYDLADRLRGPCAVAVIDRRQRRVYFARDALGVIPVCYAITDGKLVVAEGSRTIRAMTGAAHVLDNAQLASCIAGGEGDTSRTFFKGISRLPPGCWLEFRQDGLEIGTYWSPARAPAINGEFDELVARFAMLFDKAVGHAYVPGRTGLLLSGGLDSSMIAGSLSKVIGGGPDVTAVSMTYRQTPGWHDGPHLDALRSWLPFSFSDVPCDEHDPLSDLSSQLAAMDGPWISYGHSVTLHAMNRAVQQGCTVILNGHAGDEVIGYGFGRLNELAMAGRWYDLWRLAPVAAALRHESRWDVFSFYLDHIRPVRAMRKRWRRLQNLKSGGQAAQNLLSESALALVHDAFGPSPTLAIQSLHHDERMLHEAALSSPIQARAFEVFAHASRTLGVETRMPFADRDLVEFSLGLPSHAKLGGGFTRFILREAMRGRVPESVRTRGDKFDFGGNFAAGLMRNPTLICTRLARAKERLGGMINAKAIDDLQAQVSGRGAKIDIPAAMAVWRLIVADMWLDLVDQDHSSGIVPSRPL